MTALTPEEIERIVTYQARRLLPPDHPDYEDLRQEGRWGIWEATQRFNPHRGVRLATYATTRCRGRMLHYMRDALPHIRVRTAMWDRGGALPPPQSLEALSSERPSEIPSVDGVEQAAITRVDLAACLQRAHLSPRQHRCLLDSVLTTQVMGNAGNRNVFVAREKLRRAREAEGAAAV